MRWRRRRGTFAQELGKTTGGVLAAMGTLAFCKAMFTRHQVDPHVGQASAYRSAYFGGSGDLFAPFAAGHVQYMIWIGLVMAIGGSVLRTVSYWSVTASQQEDK